MRGGDLCPRFVETHVSRDADDGNVHFISRDEAAIVRSAFWTAKWKAQLDHDFARLQHVRARPRAEVLRGHLARAAQPRDHTDGVERNQRRDRIGCRPGIAQVAADAGAVLYLDAADDAATLGQRREFAADLLVLIDSITRHGRADMECLRGEFDAIELGDLLQIDDQIGSEPAGANVIDEIRAAGERPGAAVRSRQKGDRFRERAGRFVFEISHEGFWPGRFLVLMAGRSSPAVISRQAVLQKHPAD